MGDWKPDENPYLVLGLTFESTKDDIKKVGCACFAELSARLFVANTCCQPLNTRRPEYKVLCACRVTEGWYLRSIQTSSPATRRLHRSSSRSRGRMKCLMTRKPRKPGMPGTGVAAPLL